jgi:hypothetical protein
MTYTIPASPSFRLVAQPGSIDPHPASLSSEADRVIPKNPTDWNLFQQVINVVDATTTDRKQLAHDLKLYHWWSIWNQLVFRSSLQPCFLSVENAEYGSWLGFCQGAPTRKIAISLAAYSARKSLDSEGGAAHHGIVERPAPFKELRSLEWNACLVLLHEMMHDSIFNSAGHHHHEDALWASLCNMIGRDALGLPRNYGGLVKRKLTVKDENGNTVMIPHSDGKTDEDGNVIMKPKRETVWEWSNLNSNTDNGFKNASVQEMRSFPYLEGDPFIEMHTSIVSKGKLVAKNNGEPVIIPPQF